MKRKVDEKTVSSKEVVRKKVTEKKVVKEKAPETKIAESKIVEPKTVENKIVEDKVVENKIVSKREKTKKISSEYLALLCGDIVLLILVCILNEPDVNTIGVAIMCTQLFGYLFNVYLNDRTKLTYLFISFMPIFISLYLIIALFVR